MSARKASSALSLTLEAEPTDTNILLPSGENTTSRVLCPPRGSVATIVAGLAPASVSPLR